MLFPGYLLKHSGTGSEEAGSGAREKGAMFKIPKATKTQNKRVGSGAPRRQASHRTRDQLGNEELSVGTSEPEA